MVRQLLKGSSDEQIEREYGPMYVGHGLGVYPMSAGGVPFNAFSMQSKGDPITDIAENMAAEQKARSTYEYLLDLADDPDVIDPLRFLRQREIVHFQRFGEAKRKDTSKSKAHNLRCFQQLKKYRSYDIEHEKVLF